MHSEDNRKSLGNEVTFHRNVSDQQQQLQWRADTYLCTGGSDLQVRGQYVRVRVRYGHLAGGGRINRHQLEVINARYDKYSLR